MISISHAPNTTADQRRLARSLLFQPWSWLESRGHQATPALRDWFSTRFTGYRAVPFSTGREALYAVLSAAGIGHGDEVVIQAYTCIVVPHAVLWTGASPVYVDIDETLNINADELASVIGPKTKAIIVQHTFGVPADMERIKSLCDANKLLLIEDCAHALGARVKGKEVGTWGDAAIFSFGRDKVVSSVAGGKAITRDKRITASLQQRHDDSPRRSRLWVKQNLIHAAFFANVSFITIRLAQLLRLLNRVYTKGELSSQKPKHLTYRMPNATAVLAQQQLQNDLDRFARHRLAVAGMYQNWASAHGVATQHVRANASPSWLRFTLLVAHAAAIAQRLRRQGIIAGDWYRHVIMPQPQGVTLLGYTPGSCPKAEQAATMSLNLPTYYALSPHDAEILLTQLEQAL